jgi:hypothetical protein
MVSRNNMVRQEEKMDKDYAKETCKIGQGEECCAFLVMGTGGFECAKGTSLHNAINLRLAEGTMNAKGDNCEGYVEAKDE